MLNMIYSKCNEILRLLQKLYDELVGQDPPPPPRER
jgi:hypothetical protein